MNTLTPYWNEKRKRWEVKASNDGKRKTFVSSKIGQAGMNESKRKAKAWQAGAQLHNRRLSDAWPEYLDDVDARGGKINYAQRESHGNTYIKPMLGHKLITAITTQDWQKVVNTAAKKGVKGKPLSAKSLRNLRGTITDFSMWAKRSRLMEAVPEIYLPKHARQEKSILQPTDLRKLFDPVENWYIHAWRFMVITGLRPGEVYGLKKSDVINDMIVVKRSVNPIGEITDGKTAKAQRTQKQHAFTRQIISDQMEMLKQVGLTSPWLFPARHGGHMTYSASYSAWQRYTKAAGLDCTLYELRHTFMSLMHSTLSESALKRIVGHSDEMDTIGTYVHEVDGELEEAARQIEKRWTLLVDTFGKNTDTEQMNDNPKVLQIGDYRHA